MRQKKKLSKKERLAREYRRFIITEVTLLFILTVGSIVWLYFGINGFSERRSLAKQNFSSMKDRAEQKMYPLTGGKGQTGVPQPAREELGFFKSMAAPPSEKEEEPTVELTGVQTLLFFGVDNRSTGQYDTGNSDSIMICAVDHDAKEVRIASVYRDTFLDTANGSFHKANYAYNYGGVDCAVAMLQRNLDIEAEDYIVVDFKALTDAVDAVGGVDLDEGLSEAEVAHIGLGESEAVTVGQTHLDGAQALAYCRIRHSDSDFLRAQRQRRVLAKLVEKAKSASLSEIGSLVMAILPEVSTNLSISDIMDLANAGRSYRIAATTGFPFDKRGAHYGSRGQVVVPCTLESNVQKLHLFLYGDDTFVPSLTVEEISRSIRAYSGFSERSAVDYGKFDTVDQFEVTDDFGTADQYDKTDHFGAVEQSTEERFDRVEQSTEEQFDRVEQSDSVDPYDEVEQFDTAGQFFTRDQLEAMEQLESEE